MFYASELYSLAPYTILHPHSLDQYYIHVTNSQRNIYPVHLFDHDGARLSWFIPPVNTVNMSDLIIMTSISSFLQHSMMFF